MTTYEDGPWAGQPRSENGVATPAHEGERWQGPKTADWVRHIARLSTPKRELADDGSFRQWVDPPDARRSGEPPTARPSAPSRAGVRLDGSPGLREPVTG